MQLKVSPMQREAITFTEGAMLVLAGPGSGKTTVISERVRYLIEEKNVDPSRILIITFTKAAALEMQSRCQRICPCAVSAVFGTFHSVFYHILRKSEKYQKFTLINEKEKKKLMKTIIPVGTMTKLQHAYVCESMLKKISFYKNSCQSPEAEEEDFIHVMGRYCRLCEEQEKLDYDDMLILCQRLLEENIKEREKWQTRFQYILVDEFQDINRCQYEIVKKLTCGYGNLFAVGDDDQAIYSFRGSDPRYMQQFLIDYPECRKVFLEENYRSGEEIVSLAGKCIEFNENRFMKNPRSMCQFKHNVAITWFESPWKEAEAIVQHVIALREKTNEKSIAVLVRTNAQAEQMAELFYQMNIPCSIREKRTCFYENLWVSDILAVLRFASCGQKRSDFLMFMNKPFRGFERGMLKTECVNFDRLLKYEEVAGEVKRIKNCTDLIRRMDPYGAIKLVLHGMKYYEYLEEISVDEDNIKIQIKEVIEELLSRAKKFVNIVQFLEFVKEYTETFRCKNMKKSSETADEKERVQILTYHASKGLEFDCVYLPMLVRGKVPHGHMLTKEQMEEERRMFYVAMTRAKQNLRLSWHGKEASVFLKELQGDTIGT